MTNQVDLLLSGFSARLNHGNIGLATSILVRGDRTVLVDVGHIGRRPHLLQALKGHGLTPADIDTVVLTHLHWDHAQNIEIFPHAEIVVHRKELDWATSPPAWDPASSRMLVRCLEEMQLVVMESEDHEITGGVSTFRTPGHTDGCISVLVDEGERRSVIAGDAIASAASALAGQTSLIFGDEDESKASVAKILDLADVIYCGHDRAFQLSPTGEIVYVAGDATLAINGTLDESSKAVEVSVQLQPRPAARLVR